MLKVEKKRLKNALQRVDGRIKKTPRDEENKFDEKRVKNSVSQSLKNRQTKSLNLSFVL